MKKLVLFVLIVSMLFMGNVLTGCSGGNGGSDDDPVIVDPEPEPDPEPLFSAVFDGTYINDPECVEDCDPCSGIVPCQFDIPRMPCGKKWLLVAESLSGATLYITNPMKVTLDTIPLTVFAEDVDAKWLILDGDLPDGTDIRVEINIDGSGTASVEVTTDPVLIFGECCRRGVKQAYEDLAGSYADGLVYDRDRRQMVGSKAVAIDIGIYSMTVNLDGTVDAVVDLEGYASQNISGICVRTIFGDWVILAGETSTGVKYLVTDLITLDPNQVLAVWPSPQDSDEFNGTYKGLIEEDTATTFAFKLEVHNSITAITDTNLDIEICTDVGVPFDSCVGPTVTGEGICLSDGRILISHEDGYALGEITKNETDEYEVNFIWTDLTNDTSGTGNGEIDPLP